MANILRRLAAGSQRWLGIGPQPVAGISYDDRFVVVASVNPRDRRIRGVGVVELEPRTVVSGSVERPAELASAIGQALASLRLESGTQIGVCLPAALDHRGPVWPDAQTVPDFATASAVVVSTAQAAGLDVRSVVPMGIVGARLGSLAAETGSDGGPPSDPVSVVVRSGWLCAVVNTASRFVESRTERSAEFRTPPDVRWGLSSERAGIEIDPFVWPKGIRDQRRTALLAAGAAMMA